MMIIHLLNISYYIQNINNIFCLWLFHISRAYLIVPFNQILYYNTLEIASYQQHLIEKPHMNHSDIQTTAFVTQFQSLNTLHSLLTIITMKQITKDNYTSRSLSSINSHISIPNANEPIFSY